MLLRIAACGICGSDLHMTEDPATFGIGEGFVLGHEFAGEVVRCGSGVTGLRPGDRVAVAPMRGCGHCDSCRRGEPAWCPEMRLIGGGYAEFATVAARQCRMLPDDLPTGRRRAGRAGRGRAARGHALGPEAGRQRARPRRRADRTCSSHSGRGGLAPAHVVVADINRHQEERAAAVGATGFALSGPGLAAEFRDQAGAAPDIVFECVGKRGLIDFACRLVRVHGTVVGVGLCVGGDEWDPFAALSKEIKIVFAVFFTMAEFETALEALGPGRFRPQALVTGRIGFGEVAETFEALKRRTTQCKVLIAADAG